MQFQRHSVFGLVREQALLPHNKPKPSAGTSMRLTAELVQHAEIQMQPAWLPVVAVPVRIVQHFVRVAVLVEVPEVVPVRVHSVPLAIKQAEGNRALPTPTLTPILTPTLPVEQVRHKPEEHKPERLLNKAEEYASAVPIRDANH